MFFLALSSFCICFLKYAAGLGTGLGLEGVLALTSTQTLWDQACSKPSHRQWSKPSGSRKLLGVSAMVLAWSHPLPRLMLCSQQHPAPAGHQNTHVPSAL